MTGQAERETIALNVRYWMALELDSPQNSTMLREILGVRIRRARDLYYGRASFEQAELVRVAIAVRRPLDALTDFARYMIPRRAHAIGRRLAKYLQEGHGDAANDAEIERAISELARMNRPKGDTCE